MHLSRCTRWLLPVSMLLLVPVASVASVLISVTVAPPELPVYEQPLCPEQGLMWSPGYWAWGDDGYYWVPGDWVPAPYEGALWTPPWWGWDDGHYIFHNGYWGNEVGYYGGIDYGFGYMGVGFVGGEWRGGSFAYNTAVMRVNTTVIHNTYVNEAIVRRNTIVNERHVAYNGGPGGIRHDPTAAERAAMSGRHQGPTQAQLQHVQTARADRTSYAKENGGHPRTLAMARPGEGAGAARDREPSRSQGSARTVPEPRSTAKPESPRTAEPSRPESHTPPSRNESRPEPKTEPRTPSHPSAETRTTPSRSEPRATEKPHTESRPVTPPRTESRPKTEPRSTSEIHEARPESRTEQHTKTESRPAPEAHPAPQHESRPAPKTESRPAPQRESRPAPAPKSEEKKPKEPPHN